MSCVLFALTLILLLAVYEAHEESKSKGVLIGSAILSIGVFVWAYNSVEAARALQGFGALVIAAIAVFKDEIMALVRPMKASLVLLPRHDVKERQEARGGDCYAYHFEARPFGGRTLINAEVSFRKYQDDDGQEIEGRAHRYFPWTPNEHALRMQTFSQPKCCDLGNFFLDPSERKFEICPVLKTGGDFKFEVQRGHKKKLWIELSADNLSPIVQILTIAVDEAGKLHLDFPDSPQFSD